MKVRPLLTYYVIAVAIACSVVGHQLLSADADSLAALANLYGDVNAAGGYLNIPWIASMAMREPSIFAIFVFASAPSIAAMLTAAMTGRLGQLLGMLRPWRPGARNPLRAYALLLGWLAAGFAGYVWLIGHFGGREAIGAALAPLGATVSVIVPMAFLGLLLDEGGTLEELGWRGFAQGILGERFAPLLASIVLGLLWWAWHLPREVFTFLSQPPLMDFVQAQGVFVLLCIALSIVITYFWQQVGGSVWPAILVHGGTNLWSKLLQTRVYADIREALDAVHPALASFDLRTLIVVATAAAIMAATRCTLGAPVASGRAP